LGSVGAVVNVALQTNDTMGYRTFTNVDVFMDQFNVTSISGQLWSLP
jgi:hypothetical protein